MNEVTLALCFLVLIASTAAVVKLLDRKDPRP